MTEPTQADIRAALDHLGWDDYDDFCVWAVGNHEMDRFDDLVQAFAALRLASTVALQTELDAAKAEIKRLRGHADAMANLGAPPPDALPPQWMAWREKWRAIRATYRNQGSKSDEQ